MSIDIRPARLPEDEPGMTSVLTIGGRAFGSALMIGTAGYPNRQVMLDALEASGAEIATMSIRRLDLVRREELDAMAEIMESSIDTSTNWPSPVCVR